MTYLAVIDHDHLDNAMFLTTLAQSLDRHNYTEHNCIIIHGDSEYTDRIMQTGVMREEAAKRSIRGLNHRLVNLLADEGISAIGLNGFQRNLITQNGEDTTLDTSYLNSLPTAPVWLISNLIQDLDQQERRPLPLPELTRLLHRSLDIEQIFLFARKEEGFSDQVENENEYSWQNLGKAIAETYIPDEFQSFDLPVTLTTAQTFGNLDDQEQMLHLS